MGNEPRAVELRLPADPRLLRVARTAVVSLAAELPFTLQDVEDVRIAVDELAAAVIDGLGSGATLELRFEVVDHALEVAGRVVGAGAMDELHPVAADLLGLVAKDHELVSEGDDRRFRFTKRAEAATP